MNVLLLTASLLLPAEAARFAGDDTSSALAFDMVASLHDIHGEAKNFTSELHLDAEPKGKVVIQAAGLTTGLSVRDGRMHNFCLDTDRFSTVTFDISAVRGDVEGLTSQEGEGSVVLHGQLTIRSAARDIAVPAHYRWQDGALKITGAHKIKWTDYSVPDPSIMISTLYPEIDVSFELGLSERP